MNWLVLVVDLLIGLTVGAAVGFAFRQRRDREVLERAEADADALRRRADEEAEHTRQRAETEARELVLTERARLEDELRNMRAGLEAELARTRGSLENEFARSRELLDRDRQDLRDARETLRRDREKVETIEDRLNRRGEQQDARALKLDEVEERLDERANALKRGEDALEQKTTEVEHRLYEIAQLSRDEAVNIILTRLDSELEREKAVRIRSEMDKADAEAKRKSFNIIAQAIQRSASEVSAAISVSVVPIPSDAMKGRIIGREGRNIRAFEALTGVDLIIDDTPEAVLLSSFNPIRREVAKLALSELVSDGRIHPARIEETVQKAQSEMQNYIKDRGEEAALEANVVGAQTRYVAASGPDALPHLLRPKRPQALRAGRAHDGHHRRRAGDGRGVSAPRRAPARHRQVD